MKRNRVLASVMLAGTLFASGHMFFLAAPSAEAAEQSSLHHDTAPHEEDQGHVACPADLHTNVLVSYGQDTSFDSDVIAIVDWPLIVASHHSARLHEAIPIPPQLPSDQKTVLLL